MRSQLANLLAFLVLASLSAIWSPLTKSSPTRSTITWSISRNDLNSTKPSNPFPFSQRNLSSLWIPSNLLSLYSTVSLNVLQLPPPLISNVWALKFSTLNNKSFCFCFQFYFILFYFILFYFILFYFILFYFILFYFILFYFILF